MKFYYVHYNTASYSPDNDDYTIMSEKNIPEDLSTPFASLTPETVMQAIESQGYLCDGRILALNSYENRVYQVGIEDQLPIIAKFYRPYRWSNEQIQEEHDFCFELADDEIPVICPTRSEAGESLRLVDTHRIAIFKRKGGRAPDIDQMEHLNTLAQTLGRMHATAKTKSFTFRPTLTLESYGIDSINIIQATLLPDNLKDAYQAITSQLISAMADILNELTDIPMIRTHGDCHMGNVLVRDNKPFFVDFDDARMAPAIWDLWMLLSGSRFEQTAQLQEIIEGYEVFSSIDYREIRLIETLRTLRILYFSAWLAKRWVDPAFRLHFPWFNTDRYWGEHILELKEQLSALHEPPLSILP